MRVDLSDSEAWARLLHAYGPATETPAHLAALENGDPAAVEQAFEHLWVSVLHQGSIYTATAPAVEWLCQALLDQRLTETSASESPLPAIQAIEFTAEAFRSARHGRDVEPLSDERRARLTEALGRYEETQFWSDNDLVNDLTVQALIDLRSLAGQARATAIALTTRHAPGQLVPAVDLMTQATLADAQAPMEEIAAEIRQLLNEQASVDEIPAVVLSLGELGTDTDEWLDSPQLTTRVAAALAPAVTRSSRARQVLVLAEALKDPSRLDADFRRIGVPQFDRFARFYAIDALLKGTEDFAEILSTALACLPAAHPMTVEHDWGAFLLCARGLHPGALSAEARTYLAAVVQRDDLWDPQNGNAMLVFKDADLPYDRAACAELAGVQLPSRIRSFLRRRR